MKNKDTFKIQILTFEDQYASYFYDINIEWLKAYFYIEDYDQKILSQPREYIIDKGGEIFFAKVNNDIVGTAALINKPHNSFELSKMGVFESHRGLKLGDRLMQTCIDYSKSMNKANLWLESNRILTPAISLYHKFGFKETPLDPENSL